MHIAGGRRSAFVSSRMSFNHLSAHQLSCNCFSCVPFEQLTVVSRLLFAHRDVRAAERDAFVVAETNDERTSAVKLRWPSDG